MKICDFCSTAKILMDFIGESKNINQIDFMYELFKDFMESDEAKISILTTDLYAVG